MRGSGDHCRCILGNSHEITHCVHEHWLGTNPRWSDCSGSNQVRTLRLRKDRSRLHYLFQQSEPGSLDERRNAQVVPNQHARLPQAIDQSTIPRPGSGHSEASPDFGRRDRWVWLNCPRWYCLRAVPFALAPAIIQWGAAASSDMLRQRTRCAHCGHRGAVTVQTSSWARGHLGLAPLPVLCCG